MRGDEVYAVLKKIGVTHLHHANSVTTSCTFLEHGALLSRGFVEDNGLKQTQQPSDQIDKEFGVWHLVFLDHVDIHDRAGRKKGPNQYGPVLFLLDLDALLGLPERSDVRVACENPIYWRGKPDDRRWFHTVDELTKSIHFGDFGKMLMIETQSGKVDFPKSQARIILDDPQRKLSDGKGAFEFAESRLKAAAKAGAVSVSVARRDCAADCICVKTYAAWKDDKIDFWFR